MKVALIPPKGLENYALRSKFHLALAIPLLMERRQYAGMYRRAVTTGDFVILDNGLAEGKPIDPDNLMRYARELKVQEVVAPDVMLDSVATVGAVSEFFKRDMELGCNFMAVAQGTKMDDFRFCVKEFAEKRFITTIGVPRHMLETVGRSARIDLATWINDKYPDRFEIHFLGTNPVWLPEVRSTVKYAPFVRSVDTSLPFSYAIEREDLRHTRRVVRRPEGYFDDDWSAKVSGSLLRDNIYTLLEWANALSDGKKASIGRVREVSA